MNQKIYVHYLDGEVETVEFVKKSQIVNGVLEVVHEDDSESIFILASIRKYCKQGEIN